MFQHIGVKNLPVVQSRHKMGKHFYETPNGDVYPSITTMLGHKEKPYITEWRNMLGDKKADKEQKRCSERGDAIHSMAEKYINNEPYPELTKEFKREHINGFNQLRTRLNNIDNVRAQEVALYSDTLKLAGRVDCIAEYNGELSIIDFKTSNNNKTADMIEDYFLQCAAYALMWFEMTGESIEKLTILMSVERGMVPLVFQDDLDKYLAILLKRTNEYYQEIS